MTVTEFIVAIELGSTEIRGVAGRKNSDGSIQILAHASERSSDWIKKGVIYNSDKTQQCLVSVLRKLEEQLGASIKKAYVGVGGQSVRSIENRVSRQFNEETKISQALVDSLMKANREMALSDMEILAVVPQEYKIGKDSRIEPVGISAESIEGHYLNVIARRSLKDKIKQCFRQARCEVADYLLSPLATADAVLTDNEKRSGCALVDMGAETTTVSIYKNNILRHLAVIPLGGNSITKDICSEQIEEEDAEQLKIRFASAYTEPTEEDEDANKEYNLEGKVAAIKAQQLEIIVEARIKEIIANVWNQISFSKYNDKLLAGIVITGGAANMPNMAEAFRHVTNVDKIRIARGCEIAHNGMASLPKDGTCNTLIGLLVEGRDNCCRTEVRKGTQLNLDLNPQQETSQSQPAEETKSETEAELKRAQEQQKEELRKKRLAECDAYLAEAESLLSRNKFKAALKEIENARQMNLEEKREEINQLEEKINKRKKEDSWFGRFTKGLDDIMKE